MNEPHKLEPLLARIRGGETDGVDELRAALERAPDDLETLGHLSWAHAVRGDDEKALALCRRYLELAPENVEMRWRAADRLIGMGRLAEAAEAYEAVLRNHPDCEDAKTGLRYLKHRQNRKTGDSAPLQAPSQPTPRQEENRALNQAEFEKGRTRLQSLPSQLYLESTTKCNFYCQTCHKGYDPYYAEDLHPDVLERVRRELLPVNLRLSLTGYGEPTLAANFDDVLRLAVTNGSVTHFVTNVSLLGIRRLETLVRSPVQVQLSIDGATPETFEAIRAGSSFNKILPKLAMLKKLRDIHPAQPAGEFSFNIVALQQNIAELPDIVRLAHRYGIDAVIATDYAFVFRDFDSHSLRYAPELANRCLDEARAVARELGVNLLTPPPYDAAPALERGASWWRKIIRARRLFPASGRFPQRCLSPWREPYVRTDGKVVPCCASARELGNLKTHSFAQIWNDRRYRRFRRGLRGPLPPPECRHCSTPWGINGGNAGAVMSQEGLLVKAAYFLAQRLERAINFFKRGAASTNPPPNYHRGRPLPTKRGISPRNNPPGC